MVPTVFMPLAELPLTGSGKLDRKALPAASISSDRPYVAPRTSLEEQLVAIWQAVLGVERIGITDDFFALGGHSLSATQLASQMQKQFGVEIPVKSIFDAPTVGELAERVLELQLSSLSENDLSALLS
jgi:acyl carrier protein